MKTEKISGYHIILFAVCFISTAIGGTVSTLMSVYLPVAVKELFNSQSDDLDRISGYINALYIIGWTLGGFASGILSDYLGRKKSLLLSIGLYGLFTILTGQMLNWQGVVICRFITGIGVGAVLVTSVTMLSEVWPEKSRAIFIGIVSIAFPVGIFSAGLINYLFSSWRLGFLVGLIPLAISLVGIVLIRESQRWQEYADERNGSSNTLRELFSGEYRNEVLAGAITFGSMLIGLWAIFSWLPTWVQSLITTSNDAQKERGISMMILGMGGLTGGFLSGWVVNAVGMRKAMLTCFGVCSLLSFILFRTNAGFSPVIYAEIGVLALFFGASQGILSVYVPLLFPIAIRATATGFCFNVGRLFTALAVLFIGVLESSLGGYSNALFYFSLVFIIGLITVLMVNKRKQFVHIN